MPYQAKHGKICRGGCRRQNQMLHDVMVRGVRYGKERDIGEVPMCRECMDRYYAKQPAMDASFKSVWVWEHAARSKYVSLRRSARWVRGYLWGRVINDVATVRVGSSWREVPPDHIIEAAQRPTCRLDVHLGGW